MYKDRYCKVTLEKYVCKNKYIKEIENGMNYTLVIQLKIARVILYEINIVDNYLYINI